MTAFVDICKLLMAHRVLADDSASELFLRIVGTMLQQALERISRLRESAARSLLQLLQAQVHTSN